MTLGPHGGVMIEVPGKPLLVNGISRASYFKAAAEVSSWRQSFGWQAKADRIGPLPTPVIVYVHHYCSGRLPDAGAIFTSAKGAEDGLVDAGVLPNDSPQYVAGLFFLAPVKAEKDGLALELVSWK